MRYVISGDRSAHPNSVIPIVQQLLLQIKVAAPTLHLEIIVGLDRGVEAAVKFVCEAAGIDVIQLEWDASSKDWNQYAERISSLEPAKVFFIHSDPASSSIYPAFSARFEDDVLELVSPELLFSQA